MSARTGRRIHLSLLAVWVVVGLPVSYVLRDSVPERRARRFPTVRYFEVRSMDDPGYKDAPLNLMLTPLDKPERGFKSPVPAAKKAWNMWQGKVVRTGQTQGLGGWYFWHSGRPAFQGAGWYPHLSKHSTLTNYALATGLVVKGVDGRYYPNVTSL